MLRHRRSLISSPRRIALAMLAILSLVTVACGGDSGGSAETQATTTTTAPTTTTAATTTVPTTTTTTVPTAVVSGRVYLADRDEPVLTSVDLMLGDEDEESVGTIQTDEDGHFAFSITDPGTYSVQVSLGDTVDMCENLRTATPLPEGFTSSGWPVTIRTFEGGGVTDVLAGSGPRSIEADDDDNLIWSVSSGMPAQVEWINDLVLNCD